MKKMMLRLFSMSATLLVTASAFAQDGAAGDSDAGVKAIAAALAIGIAAFGGALGQGNAAGAGLEAMGRNPNASLMAPFIVGLALIESLVIYGLLVAFQLIGKI